MGCVTGCTWLTCAFKGRFISVMSALRASAHDPNSAGASVTSACEKSRTLIWLSTWLLTSGRMLS